MLNRPADRATVGPSGIRKSPRRRKDPSAAVSPFKGPVYNIGSDPAMRAVQQKVGEKIPREKNAGKVRGFRHADIEASRAKAQSEAKEFVAVMADKLNLEDDHAKAALEFAVAVVKDETVNVKDRLAAARLTLDFSKSKPASKHEVELKKAEDILDELAKDDA